MKGFLFRFLLDAIVHLASFTPVKKNRIVFCSYGGRGVGGDPGCIARALRRRHPELDIVWMLKDISTNVDEGFRKVRTYNPAISLLKQIHILFHSAATFSSANVIVCDSKFNYFKKHRGSLYIQTWHGDMPFKYIEGECITSLGKEYVRISKRDSKQTDIILSASNMMSNIFRKHFWLPPKSTIIEVGIPRNDIYFQTGRETSEMVRQHFSIPSQYGIAVYAPTFRDDGNMAIYNTLDFNKLHDALRQRFGKDWKILVRLHPNINATTSTVPYDEKVIAASSYANGEAIFKTADLLITDASSVIREFITMGKPIFLYFPDFERYVNANRTLRPLFFNLPFRRCATTDELVEDVLNYDLKNYQDMVRKFLEASNIRFFGDDHTTGKVVAIIEHFVFN